MHITQKKDKSKNNIKMKQDIRNKEPQERQAYVPASVKVIEITVQKVLCQSGGSYNDPFGGDPETL